MKVKERKNQKGITLIALVITIIVLLILAGVTLSIVFNGGIINKSQTAVDKYSEESAREKLSLAIFNYKMGVITGEAGEGKKTFNEYITEVGGTSTHNEGEKTYTVIIDGYEFIVDDSTYEITSNGGTSGGTETPVIPEVKKYKVTVSYTGTGIASVTPTTEQQVEEGNSLDITATTASGYTFKEWTITSGTGTIADATSASTTVIPTSNITIQATAVYTGVYNVGDTFTVNGETFYVIEASDENTETVTGLAALNIDTKSKLDSDEENPNYLKQSSSAGAVVFSAAGGFTAGENLNKNTTVQADTTSAVYYAMQYAANLGANLGAEGRLMTKEDLENIHDGGATTLSYGNISSWAPDWILATNYWLGSAYSTYGVWSVSGSSSSFRSDSNFDNGSGYGVRPVITISKSKI